MIALDNQYEDLTPVGVHLLRAIALPAEHTGGADWSVAGAWLLGSGAVEGIHGQMFVILDFVDGHRWTPDFSLTFRPEGDTAENYALWAYGDMSSEAWLHVARDDDHGLQWALAHVRGQ